jgi:hypothetical protein
MSDLPDDGGRAEDDGGRDQARRAFLRKASQVAVTTPAVTLLLAAGARSTAHAQMIPSGVCQGGDNPDITEPGFCDGGESDGTPSISNPFQDGVTSGDGPALHFDA